MKLSSLGFLYILIEICQVVIHINGTHAKIRSDNIYDIFQVSQIICHVEAAAVQLIIQNGIDRAVILHEQDLSPRSVSDMLRINLQNMPVNHIVLSVLISQLSFQGNCHISVLIQPYCLHILMKIQLIFPLIYAGQINGLFYPDQIVMLQVSDIFIVSRLLITCGRGGI